MSRNVRGVDDVIPPDGQTTASTSTVAYQPHGATYGSQLFPPTSIRGSTYRDAHYQWLGVNQAPARSDVERDGAAREGGPHNCDLWSPATRPAVMVADHGITASTDHQAELHKLPYG